MGLTSDGNALLGDDLSQRSCMQRTVSYPPTPQQNLQNRGRHRRKGSIPGFRDEVAGQAQRPAFGLIGIDCIRHTVPLLLLGRAIATASQIMSTLCASTRHSSSSSLFI